MNCYAAKGVVTPKEMRALEQKAIGAGYPALLLMEHAAEAVVNALGDTLGGDCRGKKVLFLCGKGNNGGDGLAAARLFLQRGGIAEVWLSDEPATEDARVNLTMLRLVTDRIYVLRDMPEEELPFEGEGPKEHFDAYVDAIFGTGFHGRPDALSLRMMLCPCHDFSDSRAPAPVIAVDIPSGLDGETGRAADELSIVHADVTVTFHAAKRGLYLTPWRDAVGKIIVADIGLWGLQDTLYNEDVYDVTRADEEELSLLPVRGAVCHKGDLGRVLIYAGSMGMAGAAAMCAKACLTAGAGLVTVACEKELIPVMQTLVPCAMCMDIEQAVKSRPACDVLAVGCGLGKSESAWRNILALWDEDRPSVWDADALNTLSARGIRLGESAVITPHIGEAVRLMGNGESAESILNDRVAAARKLQQKYGCTVVLKSDVPVVCDGEDTHIITSGTPALAKGGSGDVLCGIISALYAQTGSPCESALLGTLWHALAGKAGEKRFGMYELTADELIECLHEARKDR